MIHSLPTPKLMCVSIIIQIPLSLQFYFGWLILSLVVMEVGRWISTGLAVQLLGK